MPNNGILYYFASLRYIWRNQLLRAYWRHSKTKKGITDTVTVYLFLSKIRCLNFQSAQNGIPLISQTDYGISASLRYIQRERNQEGDTDVPCTVTVYRFMAKRVEFFHLSWFQMYFLSSSSKKCTVQQVHVVPKHRKATWPSKTEHTWRPQQRAATKARSHQTDDWRLARS